MLSRRLYFGLMVHGSRFMCKVKDMKQLIKDIAEFIEQEARACSMDYGVLRHVHLSDVGRNSEIGRY